MDGRDTPPASGATYIAQLEQKMREYGVGKIASVHGRYYAMDRDKRWERERKAFDAMVTGKAEGGAYPNPVARMTECYNNGVTDEFIIPFVVVDGAGKPVSLIRDEDVRVKADWPRAAATWTAGKRWTRPSPAARFRRTSTTCA
jgi:2,3-bisphosphoglycerate-independent phosphoglycerate mutase